MKNNLFRKILTVVLTLVLSLGIMMSVSADPEPTELADGGTLTEPAVAILGKTLQLPSGVQIPAGTAFTFDFALKSVDGDTTAILPSISEKTITYTTAAATDPSDPTVQASGFVEETMHSTDVLAGVTWPHAGVYVYTVTEENSAMTGMTYSEVAYEMTVHVANTVPYDGTLYVAAVEFHQVKDAAGDDMTAVKTAPIFVNTYEKTTTLVISKDVTGTYADTTKKFEFTLTMTKGPTEVNDGTTEVEYVGTIVHATGSSPATTSVTVSFDGDKNVTTKTFELKHGDVLTFDDLPTGTTYSLTENLDSADPVEANYRAFVKVTINGDTPLSNGASDYGDALSIGELVPINLGENDNIAAWTNEHQHVTPTGILLNNLPFVLLILLAVSGFVAYIVIKRKRGYSKSK